MNWTPEEYERYKRSKLSGPSSPTRQAAPGSKNPAKGKGQGFDPFVALLEAAGLPAPEREVEHLIPGRNFRVDYCWREQQLVVEKNGQIWKKGGHSSGTGLLRDYEKLNLLTLAGFRVLFFTPEQLNKGDCLPTLRILLGGRDGEER